MDRSGGIVGISRPRVVDGLSSYTRLKFGQSHALQSFTSFLNSHWIWYAPVINSFWAGVRVAINRARSSLSHGFHKAGYCHYEFYKGGFK